MVQSWSSPSPSLITIQSCFSPSPSLVAIQSRFSPNPVPVHFWSSYRPVPVQSQSCLVPVPGGQDDRTVTSRCLLHIQLLNACDHRILKHQRRLFKPKSPTMISGLTGLIRNQTFCRRDWIHRSPPTSCCSLQPQGWISAVWTELFCVLLRIYLPDYRCFCQA